jgi:hypothetical protein
MRFKRFIIVAFVLFVLAFFFLNTWQGYRYERLEGEVKALEREQKDWLENNKGAIAGLAVLSSPRRIARLAESDLKLRKLRSQERATVVFGRPEKGAAEEGLR